MSGRRRVALVQQAYRGDRESTLRFTLEAVAEAGRRGADIVCLQELHAGPYFCQVEDPDVFDMAEELPGPTSEALAEAARVAGVVIVASVFERRASGIFHNTAVVLERDGEVAGIYRKMHIPDDPGYYEKFYFTPGDLGFTPIDTSAGRLGVLVCWDQWFPEAARLMAIAGAEMLIYPTAIGWDPADDEEERERQWDAWRTVQRAHAVANGLPVIVVNRVGHEPAPSGTGGIDFWGASFVAGPQGEILVQGSEDREEMLFADVDLVRVERVRRMWPFFRDRRIDAYDGLLERYLDRRGS